MLVWCLLYSILNSTCWTYRFYFVSIQSLHTIHYWKAIYGLYILFFIQTALIEVLSNLVNFLLKAILNKAIYNQVESMSIYLCHWWKYCIYYWWPFQLEIDMVMHINYLSQYWWYSNWHITVYKLSISLMLCKTNHVYYMVG